MHPSLPPRSIGGNVPVAASPTKGQGVALTLSGVIPPSAAATGLRVLTADPISPVIGEFWYRSDTSQLCVRHDSGTTKRVTLA